MDLLNSPVIYSDTELLVSEFRLGVDYPAEMSVFRHFYEIRNLVLRVCLRFGTVGAAGDYQWNAEEEEGPYLAEKEIVGADDPDFFVVDEMWNEIDKYVLVETSAKLITLDLITDMTEMLIDYADPGWAVSIAVEEGHLLVFREKIMVTGPRFQRCSNAASVVVACAS